MMKKTRMRRRRTAGYFILIGQPINLRQTAVQFLLSACCFFPSLSCLRSPLMYSSISLLFIRSFIHWFVRFVTIPPKSHSPSLFATLRWRHDLECGWWLGSGQWLSTLHPANGKRGLAQRTTEKEAACF